MYFKLPVFIFILCALILPVIESRKSKNHTSKSKKLSKVKPDTCEFLGYEGPEDEGKHRKKNKVRLEVSGPVPSVFTPFTDDGEINYPVIPKYVKYLNSTGATAFLVGGISGESLSMTICERKKVTEAYFKEAEKYGIKTIVHIGGIEMPYVLELARFAEKLGVAGIFTTPPICSIKLKGVEDLIWYLSVISKYAPSLPLLYYHYPQDTGMDIEDIREFHIKLSTQVGNYKGMTTSLIVALQIADLVRLDQEIFIRRSLNVAPAALMGFGSSMTPVHNIALELVYKILNAIKAGENKKARKLQSKLNKIVAEINTVAEIVPAAKAWMEMTTDIEVGPMRPPQRLTEKQRKSIHDILENNDIETNTYNWG